MADTQCSALMLLDVHSIVHTYSHIAAQRGDTAAVRTLLQYGADPKLRDGRAKLPAQVAATPELAELLRQAASGVLLPSASPSPES